MRFRQDNFTVGTLPSKRSGNARHGAARAVASDPVIK